MTANRPLSTRLDRVQMDRRSMLRYSLASAGALALAGCGGVQTGSETGGKFPSKSLQLVVPWAPGGSTDSIGRAMAKGMESGLGQSVAVVNKPGAGGSLAAVENKGLKPDGYNLVLLSANLFTVMPLAIKDGNLPAYEDFTVVKNLTYEPIVLHTRADGPFETLDDLLKLKGDSKGVTYSSTGAGTTSQFASKLGLGVAGIKSREVPFDGGAPAVAAVLGGQVDVGSNHPKEVSEQVKAGKIRILGVFSPERSDLIPDVPTIKEQGLDVTVEQLRFIVGPKGMPQDVVAKLSESIEAAAKKPEWAKFLKDNLITDQPMDSPELKTWIDEHKATFEEQIKKHGIDFTKGQ